MTPWRRRRVPRRGRATMLAGMMLLAGLRSAVCVAAETAPRLGILVQDMGRAQTQAVKGLTEELKRLGYRERRDFFLETRNVKGNRAALQPAAADLVARNVKLLFTTGSSATRAAMAATTGIPVLFVHPGDPEAAGLLKGGAHRAGNLTGVAAYAAQATERRLALFKEILPSLRRIWVFFDGNNAVSRDYFKLADTAAKASGVETVAYPTKSGDELKTTLASLQPRSGSAIFQIADDLFEGEAEYLFEVTRAKKIPTMFNEESWAIAGALAAYGPNYLEMGRQAGRLADRLLRNQGSAGLPIERAAKFDLTLNYRTATFIGVQLSREMLKKADKVIR